MVKNFGGNKAKKQGRKFANSSQTLAATRLSTDPDELYACCSKIFGNGRIGVLCHDGKERICVIRNKFRGRGKRGNKIEIGSWLLVGRRDFEKVSDGKKETTDLLVVYSGRDITNLKQKAMEHARVFKEFEKFGTVAFDCDDDDYENGVKFEEEQVETDYYDGIDLPPEEENEDEDEENEEEQNGGYKYEKFQEEEEIDVDDI